MCSMLGDMGYAMPIFQSIQSGTQLRHEHMKNSVSCDNVFV